MPERSGKLSKLTEEELTILNATPTDEPNRSKIKWPKIKKWKRRKTKTTLEPSRTHPGTSRAREILTLIGRSLKVCETCGVKGSKMHIHHKDRNPYNNEPSNLLVLCKHCHSRRHDVDEALQDIKEEDYALGVIEAE